MKKNPSPPITFAENPRLKVAELPIKFRSKGRFSKPGKATSFEVIPPGKRKAIKGEIPKEFRKSVKLRKQYVADQLIAWSKVEAQKKSKTARSEVKRLLEKKKAKPVSKAETKRRATLAQRTKHALEAEGFDKIPASTPRLDKKAYVSPPEVEKFVKRAGVHHDPRHSDSREGPAVFAEKQLNIIKQKVEFDPSSPVEIHSFNAKATTIALREFLRPHAIKFFNEMRKQSDNAYIFRVETRNRVDGAPSTREGVGTERFIVRSSIQKQDLRVLKKEFPGLSYDELLQMQQQKDIEDKIVDLFEYFEDRYKNYLSSKVISSMAVTGFSMEVVKGVM